MKQYFDFIKTVGIEDLFKEYKKESIVERCCPVCGKGHEKKCLVGSIFECCWCKTIFKSNILKEDTKALYPDSYYVDVIGSDYQYENNSVVDLLCSKLKMGRILDIGCGGGDLLHELWMKKGYTIYGNDISDKAQKTFSIPMFVCPAEEIDTDLKFDTVLMMYSIEHLFDIKKVFEVVKRVLTEDGTFVVQLWIGRRASILLDLVRSKDHFQHFTKKAFYKVIKCSGFKIVEWFDRFYTEDSFVFIKLK